MQVGASLSTSVLAALCHHVLMALKDLLEKGSNVKEGVCGGRGGGQILFF